MDRLRNFGRKETKSSSTNEDNDNYGTNGNYPSSPESAVNLSFEDTDEKMMLLNDSLNMSVENEGQEQSNDITRALNSSRTGLNKLKDQITQRARTVITKNPSSPSTLPSPSPSTNSFPSNPVYWTEIFIERGKDLAIKDIGGTSDPYVKVFYGTEEKYTTTTVSKSLNPLWNEKFTIFAEDLNIPVYFRIFDHDRIGRDEAMGTAKLDLWKLPFERLYAATLELEDEKRNDGKNGTLKVSVTITPKTTEFRDEVLRTLARQTQLRGGRPGTNAGVILPRRTIDVFVVEGRNLVSTSYNKICSPYVRLKYGTNKKYRTTTIKATTNPQWHQSFMYDTHATELSPLELTVFDDTSGSGDFLGRGLCNLAHLDEERTHQISVDLEDGTGVVDLFVTITVTTALQEATNDGENAANVVLDRIPSKLTAEEIKRFTLAGTLRSIKPIFDVGRLEIKIYQARELAAKDLGGKSDPFCIIELDSNRLRTHTIYKTLNPVWNKSFIIPVQDIHSTMEITIYDEDQNKTNEFIGKIIIPLLAIKNGEKKWVGLKDQKCLLPVKGAIEIEATLIYANIKAVARTFNPRQTAYYQVDGKLSVGAIKQHVARVQSMLKSVFNVLKFIDYCFHWENPYLSFAAFMSSLVIVWTFELYMLPCTLLLLFARNAFIEYRRGRLGKPFATLGDEAISAVVQPAPVDEEMLEDESAANAKEQKKSFMAVIQGIKETVFEVQGYIDGVASTLERIKNLFNFTVPWLSVLLIIILFAGAFVLYYIPLRYLILAFVINKFTKRFRKPKDYIDNNELADFMSRLPSDPELMQYREQKIFSRLPSSKKTKRPVNTK